LIQFCGKEKQNKKIQKTKKTKKKFNFKILKIKIQIPVHAKYVEIKMWKRSPYQ
jgi:hypothetical protein